MNVYLDSSAAVKFFHPEDGSEVVTSIVEDTENVTWLCELVRLEFCSAVMRRFRLGEIDEDKVEKAFRSFYEYWDNFCAIPLDRVLVEEAEKLVREYGAQSNLKSLDAIHAAAFSLVCPNECVFVTADKDLNEAVSIMGYKTFNPVLGGLAEFSDLT